VSISGIYRLKVPARLNYEKNGENRRKAQSHKSTKVNAWHMTPITTDDQQTVTTHDRQTVTPCDTRHGVGLKYSPHV
jgi:hypothetical protein